MGEVILITGAAGFIGRHLCVELISRDHDIIALDSDAERLAALPIGDHGTKRLCDIRNVEALESIGKSLKAVRIPSFTWRPSPRRASPRSSQTSPGRPTCRGRTTSFGWRRPSASGGCSFFRPRMCTASRRNICRPMKRIRWRSRTRTPRPRSRAKSSALFSSGTTASRTRRCRSTTLRPSFLRWRDSLLRHGVHPISQDASVASMPRTSRSSSTSTVTWT